MLRAPKRLFRHDDKIDSGLTPPAILEGRLLGFASGGAPPVAEREARQADTRAVGGAAVRAVVATKAAAAGGRMEEGRAPEVEEEEVVYPDRAFRDPAKPCDPDPPLERPRAVPRGPF